MSHCAPILDLKNLEVMELGKQNGIFFFFEKISLEISCETYQVLYGTKF